MKLAFILKDIIRNREVSHGVRIEAEGMKRFHACFAEFRLVVVIHLEVKDVIINKREEGSFKVQSYSTKHLSSRDGSQLLQSFHHILEIAFTNGHATYPGILT